ncbi:rod shape-determining protein MreD [Weissella tructae]|uniref:Rod shape-determining protein MreD n=2 Tax=Weissella TaxID=46255 RepID=A0ABN4DG07_9LACO|nr:MULTISPECIES: rod shape-determining protein MreD [Weissella]AIG65221.1 putative rod shape-determining protein MreD [Weissella tructae]AIM62534.1 putative rod shape-determining protein MreD [Weissella ceti]AIM63870.1 putative rod shape-determining protein MreD [Weissella ceti]ELA07621.1 rod shape-determining protein MreD [Weissella ceti NC36]QVV91601.1 rod shape-determining protein MreD [Weissella tructae]
MLKYIHTTWLHVILAILALFLDGGIAFQFAGILFQLPISASPYLCLLVLLMPVLSGTSKNQVRMRWSYGVAMLVGLIYDITYIGIIGISFIGFPLTVWVTANIKKFFANTMSWALATWFLSLTFFLIYDYLAFGIINMANVSVPSFIIFHLFPTLLVNLILFFMFYGMLDYLYRSTRQLDVTSYSMEGHELDVTMPLRRRTRKY